MSERPFVWPFRLRMSSPENGDHILATLSAACEGSREQACQKEGASAHRKMLIECHLAKLDGRYRHGVTAERVSELIARSRSGMSVRRWWWWIGGRGWRCSRRWVQLGCWERWMLALR